jgi:hypothetical protein
MHTLSVTSCAQQNFIEVRKRAEKTKEKLFVANLNDYLVINNKQTSKW